jgi:hypothetical protein
MESKFDVLGIVEKLVKYDVYLSKNINYYFSFYKVPNTANNMFLISRKCRD